MKCFVCHKQGARVNGAFHKALCPACAKQAEGVLEKLKMQILDVLVEAKLKIRRVRIRR